MQRRVPLRRAVLTTSALLLVTFAAVLLLVRMDRVVVAEGRLRGGVEAVRAPRDGVLTRFVVRPGEEVAEGALLGELDAEELERALDGARALVRAAEVERDALTAERRRLAGEEHPRAARAAAAEVERNRLQRDAAAARLERLETLAADGLARQLEVEEARLERDLGTLAHSEAEADAEHLATRQAADLERLDAEARRAEAALAEAEAALDALVLRRERSRLVAPVAGVVVAGDPHDLVGRAYGAGDVVLSIGGRAPERFEGHLGDAARGRVHAGARVRLRLDAYPYLLYGTVEGVVAFVADTSAGDAGFAVRVALRDAPAPGVLVDGMRGTARIVLEERVSLGRYLVEALVGAGR